MIIRLRRLSTLSLLLLAVAVGPVHADGWLQSHTEHFTFIYKTEQTAAADHLLRIAEPVYQDVTELLANAPDHVNAVIYGDSDIANGYYSPAPPHHIGLYVATPTLPWQGTRTEDWLRYVLVHELTHFVQATQDSGVFHILGSIFGESIQGVSLGLMPIWAVEGLAVTAETRLTAGGRGTDPFFRAEYLAPAWETRLPTLVQAGYNGPYPPAGRYYSSGYYLWDYLVSRYGDEVIDQVIERFNRFPFFGIWGPIRRATGQGLFRGYDEIEAWVAREAAETADIRLQEGQQSAVRRGTPLTPQVRGNYFMPTVTDRGVYLYREAPDQAPGIVRMIPGSNRMEPVLLQRLTDHASWTVTPDGESVYFATFDADYTGRDEPTIRSNLFVLEVATGSVRRLTAEGGYAHPAISPDGTVIYATRRSGSRRGLVRLPVGPLDRAITTGVTGRRSADGPGEGADESEWLLEIPGVDFYTPAVSPDGETVIVVANFQGSQNLLEIEAASGNLRVIPTGPTGSAPHFPVFGDSDTVYYGLDVHSAMTIRSVSLSTGLVQTVDTGGLVPYAVAPLESGFAVGHYTADGFAVREIEDLSPMLGPAPELADQTPVATGAKPFMTGEAWAGSVSAIETEDSAGPEADSSFPQREPYLALPRPVLWYPSIGIASGVLLFGSDGASNVGDFGAGAGVFGSDLLGRNVWQADLIYYPGLTQADASIQWQTVYGPWAFAILGDHDYQVSPQLVSVREHTARLTAGLSGSFAIVSRYRLGVQSDLSTTASVVYAREASDTAHLDIGDVFTAGEGISSQVTAGIGLFGRSIPRSAAQAYVSPWARRGELSLYGAIPGIGDPTPGLRTRAAGSLNIGLGRSNHVVQSGVTVTHSTALSTAVPLSLTGFESTTDLSGLDDLRGSARFALRYYPPLLLADIPLIWSTGITGLGVSFFVEALAGFDFQALRGAAGSTLAVGLEALAILQVRAELPISIGVAFQIDLDDPGASGWIEGIGVYADLSVPQALGIRRLQWPGIDP